LPGRWVAFYLVFGGMPEFARMIADTATAMVIAGSVFMVEHRENER
jgi:hypothetical protein